MFQYLDDITGISDMVKYLLSWSNVAVVPALLGEKLSFLQIVVAMLILGGAAFGELFRQR